MSGKPIVPGLIRRGNKFSVRIQVPKDLQDHIGRREFWIKLGTEDRYDATSRALNIIRDKRNEFEQARRRVNGDYRIAAELTSDEVAALGREVYHSFLKQADKIDHGGKHMTPDQWNDYVQPYESHLADLEADYARQGDTHDFATDFADQVLDLNLIKIDKSSKSYRDLCRLALGAALEVQRRIVARLHGREFPDQPDPRFVGPEGQTHRFIPVRDQTKQVPQSASLHSLIGRYVTSVSLAH